MDNGTGLLGFGNDRAAADRLAGLYGHMDVPFFLCVQGIDADTSGDVVAGLPRDLRQRTLDTVENIVQDSRTQNYRERVSGGFDDSARFQSGRFLKDLDGRRIFGKTDDFADKTFFANINHFGHLESGVALQVNDRTVDAVNDASLIHVSYLREK